MSHFKIFLLFVLLSYSYTLYAQKKIIDPSLEYYNEGAKAFSEKNYPLADSLYTLSIRLYRHPDTYYNRAMTRKKLNNFKGFCTDLDTAALMLDTEARKEFWKYCGKIDTIYYDSLNQNVFNKNYNYYVIISACSYTKYLCYEKYNIEKKLLLAYIVQGNDTMYGEGENLKHAEFNGGDAKMYQFIQKNLLYPEYARDNGIQGKVFLSFIITKEGKVKDLFVIKGNSQLVGESLRVGKMMSNWKPAIFEGKPVNSKFILPLSFKLN